MRRIATLKWLLGGAYRWATQDGQGNGDPGFPNIERPQKRWIDDIKARIGRNCYQTAQDRLEWRKPMEAYVPEWMSKI